MRVAPILIIQNCIVTVNSKAHFLPTALCNLIPAYFSTLSFYYSSSHNPIVLAPVTFFFYFSKSIKLERVA